MGRDKQTRKAWQKNQKRRSPTEPKWGLLTNHSQEDTAGSPIGLQSPGGLTQPPLRTWELPDGLILQGGSLGTPSRSVLCTWWQEKTQAQWFKPLPPPMAEGGLATQIAQESNFHPLRQQQGGLSESPRSARRSPASSTVRAPKTNLSHKSRSECRQ